MSEAPMPPPFADSGPRRLRWPTWLAVAPAPAGPAWSQPLRIAFRFVFSYLVLPESFGLERSVWQPMVTWVGRHVFQLSGPLDMLSEEASGDATSRFVLLFCKVVLAAAAVLAWTLLDRRSRDHRRLHAGLTLYVRYLLGSILLTYGMLKLIKVQFIYPLQLEETYGDMSPMGLLWKFIGFSTPYNLFAGAAEAGAAVLLFFRRTATLGALLAVAAMTNVVMINFSYDVSVKLWALTLLLMAAFLLAPDLRRLADLLVLQRPTAPKNVAPPSPGPRWRRVGSLVLKTAVIGYLVISTTKRCLDHWWKSDRMRTRYEAQESKAYEVDDFIRNGWPVPPSPHDSSRWQSLTFIRKRAVVTAMDDQSYPVDYDAARQTLAVPGGHRGTSLGALTCSRPDADHLVLTGTLANESLIVILHSRDPKRYFLARRGFHWIDEAPEER